MCADVILTNARIVTRNEVFDGTVELGDGVIRALDRGRSHLPEAIDLAGDYLLPGLVELHTDNIEKNFSPRPGVAWPPMSAALAHDSQIIAAGITTVFDALRAGDVMEDQHQFDTLKEMSEAIEATQARGLSRAEHWFHIRCEVGCPGLMDHLDPYREHPMLRLISVMDHAPGQRQFTDLDMARLYYGKKYALQGDELERRWSRQIENSAQYSEKHRREIARFCRRSGISLASHDDATSAHIDEAVGDGVAIAEFPTTTEAAKSARDKEIYVLAGGPNIVRGGSHSGNVSATALAEQNLLSIVSSDYVPSSMMDAVFKLARDCETISLPQAVSMITLNPAHAAGMDDRGVIALGKRADIVRVHAGKDLTAVRAVWREGERVY